MPLVKANDPYIQPDRKPALLFQLERRVDVNGSSVDEALTPQWTPQRNPLDQCRTWRGTLRFQPQLKMRPYAPALTGEESREAPHNSNGDLTFLRQHERVPEVPVQTREELQVSCLNSRNPGDAPLKVR